MKSLKLQPLGQDAPAPTFIQFDDKFQPALRSSRELEALAERLLRWFESGTPVLVAFSGGVDSALVLAAAVRSLGPSKVTAVIADSPSLARRELQSAITLAESLGVSLTVLRTDEMESADYRRNDTERCYHCKASLYRAITKHPQFAFHAEMRTVVDGTNHDDRTDIRPGLRASDEARVRHPLADCGLTKHDIREISRLWNLPTWNKPEMACLASRIAHGTAVSESRLHSVERAEAALESLGFPGCRVRLHELGGAAPARLARVELAADALERAAAPAMRQEIVRAVRESGFEFVTLDLEGYRKGGRIQP